jgi:hypothetical protein
MPSPSTASNQPMAQSAHTPGPWATKLHPTQISVYGPGDICVLSTSWHGSIRASYPLKDESIANAKLAAAAPELLEALQECVLQLEYLADKFGPTGTGAAVLARVDAVINKATGA